MYCTMFCNLECVLEANDSHLLTYSHTQILEMLSHLKITHLLNKIFLVHNVHDYELFKIMLCRYLNNCV